MTLKERMIALWVDYDDDWEDVERLQPRNLTELHSKRRERYADKIISEIPAITIEWVKKIWYDGSLRLRPDGSFIGTFKVLAEQINKKVRGSND